MKKTKKSIYILFAGYFALVAVFLATMLFLPRWMDNAKVNYGSEVQQKIETILNGPASQIPEQLEAQSKKTPFEIGVYEDGEKIYQTLPKLSFAELQSALRPEAILLEAKGNVKTNQTTYLVWYGIYHPPLTSTMNNTSMYQLWFVFIGFALLLLSLLLINQVTVKPLRLLKQAIEKLEDYELEELTQLYDEASDDALNQSVSNFATDLQGRIRSISRNHTELEYLLQLEQERLSNLMTVSRGVIHDLKSPVHQTLIENDLLLQGDKELGKEAVEVAEYNIERMNTIMEQINEVLNLMDTDVNEMLTVKNTFDIIRTFKDTRKNLRVYSEEKAISLYQDMPEDLVVSLNKAAVKLILHNLLSNAVQYANRESEIDFTIYEEANILYIECSNATTQQNMERLEGSEELFYTASQEDEHTYSSGNGVYLIKELSHVLGGTYEMSFDEEVVTIAVAIPLES